MGLCDGVRDCVWKWSLGVWCCDCVLVFVLFRVVFKFLFGNEWMNKWMEGFGNVKRKKEMFCEKVNVGRGFWWGLDEGFFLV